MGQEESTAGDMLHANQQEPQFELSCRAVTLTQHVQKQHVQKQHSPQRIEHEGILKLRDVPFKNCIEIPMGQRSLFLENVTTTLHSLLQNRLNTTKLFPVEDVEKLIESVVYALAYLEAREVIYKDIISEHIFYCGGSFRLLPNELIEATAYERLVASQQETDATIVPTVHASPELIIALRCEETKVSDPQILQKSNVFCLGMLLLEATTLLPAGECYDGESYDILDQIISERLLLVEEFYNEKLARIIGNMLDYDYSERMNMRQMAVWINRQLNDKPMADSNLPEKPKDQMRSRLTDNQQKHGSQPVTHSTKSSNVKPKTVKSNIVYMQQEVKEHPESYIERNKIYLDVAPKQRQGQSRNESYNRHSLSDTHNRHSMGDMHNINQALMAIDSYKIHDVFKQHHLRHYIREEQGTCMGNNHYLQRDGRGPIGEDRRRDTKLNLRKEETSRKSKNVDYRQSREDYRDDRGESAKQRNVNGAKDETILRQIRPHRSSVYLIEHDRKEDKWREGEATEKENKTQVLKETNRYHRSIGELVKGKSIQKPTCALLGEENLNKHTKETGGSVNREECNELASKQGFGDIGNRQGLTELQPINDHSISRIKQEIDKSRRLIEQFKQSEGLKY